MSILIFGGKFVLVIRGADILGARIRGGLYSGFYGTLFLKTYIACLQSLINRNFYAET